MDTVTSRPGLETHQRPHHLVDWGAVVAGAALASALSIVLITFGAAIGLSFTSPWTSGRETVKWVASLAVFFLVAQQIGCAIAGGYIAGRLRSRWSGSDSAESEFRDGVHGGLVWAVSVLVSAIVVASAASAVARTAADVAARAAPNASTLEYYVDTMLRDAGAARAAPAGAAATPAAPPAAPITAESRAEVVRVVGRAMTAGALSDADRSYLGTVVSRRYGVPAADAEKRVADTFAEAQRAIKEAADTARKSAILTGLVTAVGLLVSLAAAWWAGQRGGDHRDNAVPARFVTRPRQSP